MAALQPTTSALPDSAIEGIAGAVLEVPDLTRAQAFYEPIFGTQEGAWEERRRSVRYRAGPQAIELVQRARPRSFPDSGYHWGYRVPSGRLTSIAEQFAAAGHAVEWWHEDDPAERLLSAYLQDPGGNRVQLSASNVPGPLLEHVALEQHDVEHAEVFYMRALGARLTFHHGWDGDDQRGLEAWMAGDDPSAPWTRQISVSYRTKKPRPMPIAHVFVSFGETRLGLFLAKKHRQEPAPGVVRGTPRLVLRAAWPAGELADHLAKVNVSPIDLKYDGGHVRFERDGDSLFLRDPGGHFVQVECPC